MTSIHRNQGEDFDSHDILSVELDHDVSMTSDTAVSACMFDSGIAADLTNSRHSEDMDGCISNSPTSDTLENYNLSGTAKSNEASANSVEAVLTSATIAENGDEECALSENETESSEAPSNDSETPLGDKKMVKRVSFVKLLHDSPHEVCVSADLDQELATAINHAMSSYSYDKTTRAAKIEQAIQIKRESVESPRRQRGHFASSPMNSNANRYCRKPKAQSEDGSPQHRRLTSRCHNPTTVNSLDIALPMDRFSAKLFNPPDRTDRAATHLGVSSSPRQYQNGGSCFGGRGRSPRHYIIHPEWVSESFNVQKVPLSNRALDFVDKSKRSQSCPPVSRNIITWASLDNSPAQ